MPIAKAGKRLGSEGCAACAVRGGNPCRETPLPNRWQAAAHAGWSAGAIRAKFGGMTSFLWRAALVTHRYLGVAVGILMLMWFLSGIVMMYVGFPEPDQKERLRGLSAISWAECCRLPDDIGANDPIRAEVENLLGVPILRIGRVLRPDQLIDLTEGNDKPLEMDDAEKVARAALARIIGRAAAVVSAEELEDDDQWTVGRYHSEQPLVRFAFDDPDRSEIYVSGSTGRVVLRTTRWQRFWNWLGAIPHWIYPTALRSDVELWGRVVIWASILGSFLTLFGLYLGIAQFRRGKNKAPSPYRGLFYWHHMAGLVFGIVTLGFVASGLVSMHPWGFLDSFGNRDRTLLEGPAPRWGEVSASLEALRARAVTAVSLVTAPYDGVLYWLATDADGSVTRLDAAGNAAPLRESDLSAAASRLARANGIAAQGLVSEEDAYYFSRREPAVLPVYRVLLNDAETTRYYLSPATGALLQRTDANRRWNRWLFDALHRFDFAASIRARPAWDILLIALLLGGAALSATGVYLSLDRIRRDLAWLLGVLASAARGNATKRNSRVPG
jgi:uncharacterized iron-regulated membrane protein